MGNMYDIQSWTALFRDFRSHQQPSVYLNHRYSRPSLGQIGQTLMACTVAETLEGLNDFSLWYFTKEQVKNRWAFVLRTAISYP